MWFIYIFGSYILVALLQYYEKNFAKHSWISSALYIIIFINLNCMFIPVFGTMISAIPCDKKGESMLINDEIGRAHV